MDALLRELGGRENLALKEGLKLERRLVTWLSAASKEREASPPRDIETTEGRPDSDACEPAHSKPETLYHPINN